MLIMCTAYDKSIHSNLPPTNASLRPNACPPHWSAYYHSLAAGSQPSPLPSPYPFTYGPMPGPAGYKRATADVLATSLPGSYRRAPIAVPPCNLLQGPRTTSLRSTIHPKATETISQLSHSFTCGLCTPLAPGSVSRRFLLLKQVRLFLVDKMPQLFQEVVHY